VYALKTWRTSIQIGEAAKRTELSIDAIRFYERVRSYQNLSAATGDSVSTQKMICSASSSSAPCRDSGFLFAIELNMKNAVIIGLAVLVATIVGWRLLGHNPPKGQPPLTDLTQANLNDFERDFNASPETIRVLALLSPT